MDSQSSDLNSYLKSMFAQYHNEPQTVPKAAETKSSTDPLIEKRVVEEVANDKEQQGHNDRLDMNNNDNNNKHKEVDGPIESEKQNLQKGKQSMPPPPPPPPVNCKIADSNDAASSIENGGNKATIDAERQTTDNDRSSETIRLTSSPPTSSESATKSLSSQSSSTLSSSSSSVASSPSAVKATESVEIAFTFLDELKQTLNSKTLEAKNDDSNKGTQQQPQPASLPPPQAIEKGDKERNATNDRRLPDHSESNSDNHNIVANQSKQSFEKEAKLSNGLPQRLQPSASENDIATNESESKMQTSTPANDTSDNRNNRGGDDDQRSSLDSSSSNADRLTRSISTTNDYTMSPTLRRVVQRSISNQHDVKFKIQSIKEEKKVTRAHVTDLANFWKNRTIVPKDKF